MSAGRRREADGSAARDEFAVSLQELRARAGGVSYSEIATRIARRREAILGMTSAAAHVARSSVYDVFRPGRTRFNPDLVEEVVLALGVTEAEAREWRARSIAVQATTPRSRVETDGDGDAVSRRGRLVVVLAILIACVAINTLGRAVTDRFDLPIWLDMTGTAAAALALGPWLGAAVGLCSNLTDLLSGGFGEVPFAIVNVLGAVLWGYGVRGMGLGRTPLRFLALNVIVAAACAIVSVLITVVVMGVDTGDAADALGAWLVALGGELWTALLAVNLVAALVDKLLAGYFGLLVTRSVAPLLPSLGLGGARLPSYLVASPLARRPRDRAEA